MTRISVRKNKSKSWLVSLALVMLFIGIASDNYFFYPSYFNLIYISDPLAELVVLKLPGDVMEWMEIINKNIAIVMTLAFIAASLLTWIKFQGKRVFFMVIAFLLMLYYLAEWQDHGFQLPFLLEIALQAFTIWAFCFAIEKQHKTLLILSALTFAGHGIYALNIYPRPGYFVDMMITAFPFDEAQSIVFLQVVGVADLLCLLLIAYKPSQRSVLIYMVFWGLLTALARPIFNFSSVFWQESLVIWVPEFLKRGVHFLVPLYLLLQSRLPAWGK